MWVAVSLADDIKIIEKEDYSLTVSIIPRETRKSAKRVKIVIDSPTSRIADKNVPQTGIRNRYTAIFVSLLYLIKKYQIENARDETKLR